MQKVVDGMKIRYSGHNMLTASRLLIGGCLLGAALLGTAAILGHGKPAEADGWIPLNEAVKLTLEQMETNTEELADTSEQSGRSDNGAGEMMMEQGDGESFANTDKSGKLDINRASAEELDSLKGIGPAKAQAIVDDRERNGYFTGVEQLTRVKGIGEKLLSTIKDSVVARP